MEHLIYSIYCGNCEFLNTCEYDISDYRSNQLVRKIPGGLASMLVAILDTVDGGDLGFCDGGDAEKAESCPRRSEWVGSGWSRESREGGERWETICQPPTTQPHKTTNSTTTQNY